MRGANPSRDSEIARARDYARIYNASAPVSPVHEDFAVADLATVRGGKDRFDDAFDDVLGDRDLDLDLG